MNFALKTVAVFFLITSSSYADIIITNWEETTNLTDKGKESSITITAKVEGLPEGSYHNAFTIIFDQKQKITTSNVKFDDEQAKYSFRNNKLRIIFNEKKINNQKLTISYDYAQASDQIDDFLRQEFISAPSWAAGADAKNVLNIPANLAVISLNPTLQVTANQVIYEGKIPKTGLSELVKFTPKSNVWEVSIKNTISASSSLNSVITTTPIYFYNGGQKNYNNYTVPKPNPKRTRIAGNYYIFEYGDLSETSLEINTSAFVKAGVSNKIPINRNPDNYTHVESQEWFMLGDILSEINTDKKLANLPLYAKIGSHVHNFITYDKSYAGKLLSVTDIIEKRKGVCIEYAKLFNTIARMAGIPSIIINGAAKGEYDKFEGHSWNLIHHEGKWIQVDPTWNLMSGEVSSSHIYFYDDGAQAIKAEWLEKKGQNIKVDLNTDFEIKPVS